ncbi:hypothetical protein GCM10010347_63740 [Streptomyces cirratus]|uniref:Uncharacterized protein n=1 Tax=Streptomyces cirratus TaxID=68187 RepID=A0ABQ3F3Y1_9ACTN|nr:hypothetical protein [Streptomyces cirratus]GHB84058.1 hypothetical protein GCM10010347_63740 [Streptomyces cirratus]
MDAALDVAVDLAPGAKLDADLIMALGLNDDIDMSGGAKGLSDADLHLSTRF